MGVGVQTSHTVTTRQSRGARNSARALLGPSASDHCWANSSIRDRAILIVVVVVALLSALDPTISFASASAIAVAVPAAFVDLRTRRLPDIWVGSAAIAFLVSIGISWMTGSGVETASSAGIIIGALVMCGPLLALHIISPASMGFGDVKLSLVLGAALGALDWQLALAALALAAGATAVVGLVRRVHHIAFGPGLVGASLVSLLAHDVLVKT